MSEDATTSTDENEPSPVPAQNPAGQYGNRKRKRRSHGSTIEFVVTLLAAAALFFLVQEFLIKPYRIPSPSMVPTLIKGQRILVNRLDRHPKIGDVVVFHPSTGAPSETCGNSWQGSGRAQACDAPVPAEASVTYVKRLVGIGGDHLRIINGYVYRNGVKETGSYIQECDSSGSSFCDFPKTIVVPKGYYYMMGDNRSLSDDSRFWGPVPQRWIIGTAFFTYWPPDRLGTL